MQERQTGANIMEETYRSGNRELYFFMDIAKGYAITKVSTISDRQHEEGAITFLHSVARAVIIKNVQKHQTPITFHFYTNEHSMMAWAKSQDKGLGLFEWDKLEAHNGWELRAEKTFSP